VAAPTEAFAALRPLVDQLAVPAADVVVLSWVVPSLNVWIALNCWVPLTGIEAVVGFTTNDTDVAAFTVKLAVAVLPPKAAVMTTGTTLAVTPVAKPVFGPTVAPAVLEVQMEDAVTSLDDPSLYVPVAVYFWVPLTGIDAVGGVTLMETKPCKTEAEPPRIGSRPPPPFPHPATKATSSNAINHLSGL
jgi:hypothetical protein